MFLPLIQFPGPDPYAAICLIDRFGLYNTIFTNPKADTHELADTKNWRSAYSSLRELAEVDPEDIEGSSHLPTIANILLRDLEDRYLAWMMSCFVPWARIEHPALKSKNPTSSAAVAAREGIKADNKLAKTIKDAVLALESVVKMKDSVASRMMSSTSPLEIEDRSSTREFLGQAVRRWGPRWRNIAIYALLVQLSEAKDESGKFSTNPYHCALYLSSK